MENEVLMELKSISKHFAGVDALTDVNLKVKRKGGSPRHTGRKRCGKNHHHEHYVRGLPAE